MSAELARARHVIEQLHAALSSWVEIADDEDKRDSDQMALDDAESFLSHGQLEFPFYAVMGRLCGDDEDTVLVIKADSKRDACAAYIEQMWELSNIEGEERAQLEDNGEGVFINAVVVSASPILEV